MCRTRLTALVLTVLFSGTLTGALDQGGAFSWTTSSQEAEKLLSEVQGRIENFQLGSETIEMARKIVALDPGFAMGEYYLSALIPPPEAREHLDKAVELSKRASDGERRFIDAMAQARADNGSNLQQVVPLFVDLAADYPEERLVFRILGQLYQATSNREDARRAFEKAQEIGPCSNRIRSFLANDDLLEGRFVRARQTFLEIERDLPENSTPFAIRYGIAFSYLYEENLEAALSSLKKYLSEYLESGASRNFPEVFIWNSIARISLEGGLPVEAMDAYESGYQAVRDSLLDATQKQLWQGRFLHGKARVLAKMGKHQEAAAEAGVVWQMIEDGGQDAQQYLPAYHYLKGYLELEKGDFAKATEYLTQSDLNDPFQKLLLARAYEGSGKLDMAGNLCREIVDSASNSLERALAYPEARRKMGRALQ